MKSNLHTHTRHTNADRSTILLSRNCWPQMTAVLLRPRGQSVDPTAKYVTGSTTLPASSFPPQPAQTLFVTAPHNHRRARQMSRSCAIAAKHLTRGAVCVPRATGCRGACAARFDATHHKPGSAAHAQWHRLCGVVPNSDGLREAEQPSALQAGARMTAAVAVHGYILSYVIMSYEHRIHYVVKYLYSIFIVTPGVTNPTS